MGVAEQAEPRPRRPPPQARFFGRDERGAADVAAGVVDPPVHQKDVAVDEPAEGQGGEKAPRPLAQRASRAPQGEGGLVAATVEAQLARGDQVVVAGDPDDVGAAGEVDASVRLGVVADEVAQTQHARRAALGEEGERCPKRGEVGVDVGQHAVDAHANAARQALWARARPAQ
ncbi:MAG TPA: hypothetical protein VFS43_04250 [Polyangiaceae bacterium]|nr:hypothetical protein [Polyangiaceae bacterium]